MKTITVNTSVDLMGFDFYVTLEIEVTSWGCPAKISPPPEYCWPAEAPEWNVVSLELQRDEPEGLGPAWSIDGGKQFDLITELPHVENECCEVVSLAANVHYLESRINRRRRAF